MAKYTPMMEQYLKVKEENPGCLLMFRLGDFYELFFDDAITASKELELTLTGRDCGQAERAPMCGVPYHAIEGYLQKLVSKGYRVAICEQMEDPKLAQGLVKREVTRIVTPGTNINSEHVEEKRNNYIMSVNRTCDRLGIAICDITTGEFFVTEFEEEDKFWDEVAKYRPSEIIINEENAGGIDIERLKKSYEIFVNLYGAHHFRLEALRGCPEASFPCAFNGRIGDERAAAVRNGGWSASGLSGGDAEAGSQPYFTHFYLFTQAVYDAGFSDETQSGADTDAAGQEPSGVPAMGDRLYPYRDGRKAPGESGRSSR